MQVGDVVRVLPGWWANRGMAPTATVVETGRNDRLFPYAISVGDGRAWAMTAREIVPADES